MSKTRVGAIERDWLKYRSSLHEEGYRRNLRYGQERFTGAKRDPEEILKDLERTYNKTAAMTVEVVADHESAIDACKQLDAFGRGFFQTSSKLIREQLPVDQRAKSKDLVAQLRLRLLLSAEHWKAEAHKRARRAAHLIWGSKSCEKSGRRDRQGDFSLLQGKTHVTIRTAAQYVGVSERRIQQAIRDGKLESVGHKGQRKVTSESLKRYQPPQNVP